MKYKKMKFLGVLIVAGLSLVGCNEQGQVQPEEFETKQELITLKEQNKQLEDQIVLLEEEIVLLEGEVEKLTNENKTLILENGGLENSGSENDGLENGGLENSGSENGGLRKEIYKMYTLDDNTWEVVQKGELAIDASLSLKEKIQALADNLSKNLFNALPIQVKEITEVNGKKIAIINLKEDTKGTSDMTWIGDYFQGSAGAEMTETSLEETLLQRGNTAEWIDGITILYNDEDLILDHIELGRVIYR